MHVKKNYALLIDADNSLVDLVTATDLFEIKMRGDDSPQPYVYDKRKEK